MVEHVDPMIMLTIFAFMAAIFLALSFIIVLWVKSIPNKLLLLGLLVATIAVGFGAFLPEMGSVAIVLLILAVVCFLAGVICILISHIVKSIKSCNEKNQQS
ncbi:MAG: hypothetical protein ACYTFW_11290 [Planctomycetota bacterium]|jgi:hypothetical protein